MIPEIFQALVRWRLEKLTDILVTKGAEYATNGDRLHNFNSSARIDNVSKAQALHGFMLKHYTNYRDMLDKFNRDEEIPVYQIRERFGDLLAYFLIQEVIFMEKYGQGELELMSSEDLRAAFMNSTLGTSYQVPHIDPAKDGPYEPIDWASFVKDNLDKIAESLGVPVEELTKPIVQLPYSGPDLTPLKYVINVIDEHLDVVEHKSTSYERLTLVRKAAEAMLDKEAELISMVE